MPLFSRPGARPSARMWAAAVDPWEDPTGKIQTIAAEERDQGKERKVPSMDARASAPGRAKGTTTGVAPVRAKALICSRQTSAEPTAPRPSSTRGH